jgi:hypothetical protein
MKKLFVFLLAASALTANAQFSTQNLLLPFNAQNLADTFGQTSFKNLKLFFIMAKPSLQAEYEGNINFTPLDEAMAANKIVITELSNSGTVNSLFFNNISNDTIVISLGDVVKGGKQDRVVQIDSVLLPKKKYTIPVYCVEQGRWSPREGNTTQTAQPQFKTFHSKINNQIRRSIVKDKSQSNVWANVAEVNNIVGSQTETSTYTATTNNGQYNQQLAAYKAALYTALNKQQNLVGLLAVSGNKIIGVDIFASEQMFQKNLENLLTSYTSEAITTGSKPILSDNEVKNYLDALLTSETAQNTFLTENGRDLKFNGKKLKLTAF